ncbi:STAS/SEC14 domain-containing protein [Halobacillus salinarum]|uniref:STAS/SEC14 domain-containing protein n=1 Tax=Halobacillus salinarum TaxID=2932257 RepID=A0ABY4EJE1_9BACI|nr:STAS/SEC14 domain-containing protein [Halobacillus salinarum]UOQ44188.1 STAS/SEC14 domain-containing protein [Halobacillus salinarum]
MFTLLPSEDRSTIAVEINGDVKEEDAEKLDQHLQTAFGDEKPFNILAVVHDIGQTSVKGVIEASKVDAKRWDQFEKCAIVSDKNWIELSSKAGNFLPGVSIKHFETIEDEWNWIK